MRKKPGLSVKAWCAYSTVLAYLACRVKGHDRILLWNAEDIYCIRCGDRPERATP